MADSSKTEKATPKKRRDARKKGNVFLSKDAVTLATLVTSFAILYGMAGMIARWVGDFFYYCMSYISGLTVEGPQGSLSQMLVQSLALFAKTVGPVLAATALAAVVATFWQTKLLVAGESIRPKFSRISPLEGFKRLFSLRSTVEALKGILKISVLFLIIYNYITGMVNDFSNYMYSDLSWSVRHLLEKTFGMVIQIVVAFLVLAAADFLYQWWDYERQLRMSKQEIKEEYKQLEGDPQIKGKIKEAQRKMAQSRMMQQVPESDVVIRNPTHYAIALRYKPERDQAPIVLAKGVDELALRIVKVAEEHKVAVVENVPLARALYASAELNREIPQELYGAVAEVLVYLYRLGSKTK